MDEIIVTDIPTLEELINEDLQAWLVVLMLESWDDYIDLMTVCDETDSDEPIVVAYWAEHGINL